MSPIDFECMATVTKFSGTGYSHGEDVFCGSLSEALKFVGKLPPNDRAKTQIHAPGSRHDRETIRPGEYDQLAKILKANPVLPLPASFLRFAREYLEAAEILLASGGPVNRPLWHLAAHAAELAMKAVVLRDQQDPKRFRHWLTPLSAEVEKLSPTRFRRTEADLHYCGFFDECSEEDYALRYANPGVSFIMDGEAVVAWSRSVLERCE